MSAARTPGAAGVRVLNKSRDGVPFGAIYCGRPSKWGNPFAMRGEADRDRVIRAHESYLRTSPQLIADLDELRGRDLVCFCAPKRCHCDVLLRLANATEECRQAWLCETPPTDGGER